MVNLPTVRADIDEFNARSRRQDVLIGRLRPIAAVMKPVRLDIGRELVLDLARVHVTARENARLPAAGGCARPHQTINDEKILRRVVSRTRVFRRPQRLAGLGRQPRLPPVTAGEEDNILVQDERRPEGGRD